MALFTGDTTQFGGSLVVAYGEHVVSGTVVQKVTVGAGDDAQTYVIVLLGEGIWNRIVSAYWAGGELPSTEYHFHHGYLAESMATATFGTNPATGLDEWTQGVDTWNSGGLTYSGTAYVVVKLPSGVDEDTNFSDLKFICECLRVANYNANGEQLDKDGNVVGAAGDDPNPAYFFYSTNPALHMADLLLYRRRISKSRINWTKWVQWRDFNNILITWEGGLVPGRPEYQNVVNWTVGANGAVLKNVATGAFDTGASTTSSIPSGVAGFFEADIGSAGVGIGLTTNTSPTNINQCDIALYFSFSGPGFTLTPDDCNHGPVWLQYGSTLVTSNLTDWVEGDRFRIAVEADETVRVLKNGIDIPLPMQPTLTFPEYGAVVGYLGAVPGVVPAAAELLSTTMQPAIASVSTERQRKRFEAGLAFINQTDIASAIEAILYVCCADMQDGEQLVFLPPSMNTAPRLSIFDFDSTNIIDGTLKTYRVARDQKPTKMTGRYRDSDSPILKEETVPVDRDELVTLLGRENPASEQYLGTMTRGQAECVLNYQLRVASDLDLFCSFVASGLSWKVAPGDIVTITESSMDWVGVPFRVIEATDNSSTDEPDTRTFLCQIFNPAMYSDDDQKPIVANVINVEPSIADAPPVVDNVTLTQKFDFLPDYVPVITVIGSVAFNKLYAKQQFGRIWIRYEETKQPSSGSASTNRFTATAHGFSEGAPIMFSDISVSTDINTSTVYFVKNMLTDSFEVSTSLGGDSLDLTVDVTANVAQFVRTTETIRPLASYDTPFFIQNVQPGNIRVVIVTENSFQSKLPFEQHPVWSFNAQLPDVPQPTDFNGYFDDATGDLLLEWVGQPVPREKYELDIRTVDETDSLRPVTTIQQDFTRNLEESVIWENEYRDALNNPMGSSGLYIHPAGGIVSTENNQVWSKSSAAITGGFLVQWQIPRTDWNPDPPNLGYWFMSQYVGIFPDDPDSPFYSYSTPFIWQTHTDSGLPTRVYAEGYSGSDEFSRIVIPGDILGIYVRPDGVLEYHVNYSPSSKPIYISGYPVDSSVRWKVITINIGATQKTVWSRHAPEWKYLAEAQRVDNGLSSGDPLPSTIHARVRQLAYGNTSPWTSGVFTR